MLAQFAEADDGDEGEAALVPLEVPVRATLDDGAVDSARPAPGYVSGSWYRARRCWPHAKAVSQIQSSKRSPR